VNSYPGRENIVIAGNMRLRAAQALGWEEVPVLMVSVPPEIEAQWNLKDNNQWGDYIEDDLAQILTELTARGVDTEILGFEPDALERLLGLESATTQGDDDFDPALPTVPETRPGDLLGLGPAPPRLRRQPRRVHLEPAHGVRRGRRDAGRRDLD